MYFVLPAYTLILIRDVFCFFRIYIDTHTRCILNSFYRLFVNSFIQKLQKELAASKKEQKKHSEEYQRIKEQLDESKKIINEKDIVILLPYFPFIIPHPLLSLKSRIPFYNILSIILINQ